MTLEGICTRGNAAKRRRSREVIQKGGCLYLYPDMMTAPQFIVTRNMAFMHQMLLVLETFYAILTLPLSLQKREVRALTCVSFSFPPPSRCLLPCHRYTHPASPSSPSPKGKGSQSFPRNTFSWYFCSLSLYLLRDLEVPSFL